MLKEIENEVTNNKVVLYMKGHKELPMCGFSARVVEILNDLDIDYVTHNVLECDRLRKAIKEYSDWPTLPQLYINGEFIGGCDIVEELHRRGELEQLLDE